MSKDLGPLKNGARVVVIGGGPAGAGFALALQARARRLGRELDIRVLEGKRFAGEHHYNQCAGVLSPPLPELMRDFLGLEFPWHLQRGQITDYVLHVNGEQIVLHGHSEPSVALRRVQFDAYMLQAVRARGIPVLEARVVDLEFRPDGVQVYTENNSFQADVVVGAFGLDEGTAAIFTRETGYRRPQALASVVTKYHPTAEGMAAFGERIHAFLPRNPRVEFGAITPKGNHLTINIAGAHIHADDLQEFLASPDVQAALPPRAADDPRAAEDWRMFKGYFPCSLAGNFYGDRYVMVGDAAGLVRAFKGKGVTSAVQTAIRAAETMLEAGISRAAFHQHYRQANADIIRDLPYGQVIRRLTIWTAALGMMGAVVRAAQADEHLQDALYGAVSGHRPYNEIVRQVFTPAHMSRIVRNLVPIRADAQSPRP